MKGQARRVLRHYAPYQNNLQSCFPVHDLRWSVWASPGHQAILTPSEMIYVIMGVSGCGKTTLGAYLSHKLGWPLHEGDDFHPRENVEKMARGEPLTDQDRLPWLLKLHDVIQRERSSGGDAIMVCSALRRLYRQVLLFGSEALTYSSDTAGLHMCSLPGVWFLFLYGTYDLIHARMVARRGHFMQPGLLRSQFDVLEPPAEEENALLLDIRRSTDDICREIQEHLRQLS